MIRALASAVLLVLLSLTTASAERVPSSKTVFPPSNGTRVDKTVPYLTNGFTTLGVPSGTPVAPDVFGKNGLSPAGDMQQRPVLNLPFYGAKQSFNSDSFGAGQRQPNTLRPRR